MHYRILEELLACGRTNLSLVYNSNLSVLKFQNWDISALWSRFRQVEVNVSFDGIFAQSDLLRNNSSWLQLEANFETLRRTLPGLHLKINPTASVMNAFHLIPALQYWIERGFLKNPGDLTLNILDFPRHFNLQILNLTERSRLKSELTRFLDKLAAKLNPEFHQSLVVELRPLLALCDSPVYFEAERQIFRTVTFKLDRLRKEKFVDHFPEHFGLLYE
ncbi:MAG TPA: hypothetical protein DCS07_14170 [Bdellovibrionales bacterium]|nr:MAG: hypothetical protein A2070_03755 [Bdellovibrionales bacterium GWC1_52_8]HAR43757.1 hypothetical protein [Bdellovibrionales bacterium]